MFCQRPTPLPSVVNKSKLTSLVTLRCPTFESKGAHVSDKPPKGCVGRPQDQGWKEWDSTKLSRLYITFVKHKTRPISMAASPLAQKLNN